MRNRWKVSRIWTTAGGGDIPNKKASSTRHRRSTCRKSIRNIVDFTRFAPIEVETLARPDSEKKAKHRAESIHKANPWRVSLYGHPKCATSVRTGAPSPFMSAENVYL